MDSFVNRGLFEKEHDDPIETPEQLVSFVANINPHVDREPIIRAYDYAEKAHLGQFRQSGEPYITHPIEVARLTASIIPDGDAIVAALLHDTVEDTALSQQMIVKSFGERVGLLVDGLTKIDQLADASKAATEAETVRKLLLAITQDVRILIIKMADRIHNMRTIFGIKNEKRRKAFARETMDIFAPLAGRMGMMQVREELEDIAFSVMMPRRRNVIVSRLEDLRKTYRPLMETVSEELVSALANSGLNAVVNSREKRPFSIYRKMADRRIGLKDLRDIYGFRIIVDEVSDCYRALGVVHTRWATVPGRFKDHISYPKKNDYRSIHTTILGVAKGHFVELQIRTHAMHAIAEMGVAAHSLYKDGRFVTGEVIEGESRAYAWLKETVSHLSEGALSPEEFLEHTKLEFFTDQVFAFTPKGDLIALPRGATAIDFAFAVHTNVGNACTGCRIGGREESIDAIIRNGDQVEVITDSNQKSPPKAWLNIVTTGKARNAIRRALREYERSRAADFGYTVLERAFSRRNKALTDGQLNAILPVFKSANIKDLLIAVRDGNISSHDVFQALYPYDQQSTPDLINVDRRVEPDWYALPDVSGLRFRVPRSEQKDDLASSDLLSCIKKVTFPNVGAAVPGERIIGLLDSAGKLVVYGVESPSLAYDERKVWIDVRWEGEEIKERSITRLKMVSLHEPGSLLIIARVIADNDGNIENLFMNATTPSYHEITIDVGVWSFRHISSIVSQLRSQSIITHVDRVHG